LRDALPGIAAAAAAAAAAGSAGGGDAASGGLCATSEARPVTPMDIAALFRTATPTEVRG
jgi:hypothetical protein